MRPIVVLLLVLVAAVALILTLQNSSSTVPTVEPPIVGEPGVRKDPTPPTPGDVQRPEDPSRTATAQAPAEPSVTPDEVLEREGRNTLVGLVLNEQMQPLPGAKVELSRDPRMGQQVAMQWITGGGSGSPPIVVTTDEKGQYRFSNVVPRNNYYLVASHGDYSPTQEELVSVGDQGDFQGPNVVLKKGSVIEGTVTDTAGNIVPNAVLWLDSAFYSGEGESTDRLETKSDLVGHYEFKNVYPVAKQLTCMAEGYGSQTRGGITVKGEPGERLSVDFKLAVGGPIAGKVVGSDGAGIAGARIVAYFNSNTTSFRGEATSLEDGAFQIDNLNPGSYVLICEAKGYRQQKQTRVQVGEVNVIIDMVAQACITGRVVDGEGKPITKFTASVRRLAPNQVPGMGVASEETGVKETFTDAADGNFQLCGFDPGTYTVLVSSDAAAPTFSESFSITPDRQGLNLLVRVTRGGTIRGRVVSPAGAPVAGVVVTSHDDTFEDDPTNSLFAGMIPTNTTSRRVVTNSEGVFELRFLTPERYQLRLNHANYAQGKQRSILVVEGTPNDVGTITLQAGGTVQGTVIQGGMPLQGAYVHLESDSSDIVLDTRSDAQGRFVFKHVRPSNYTLSATYQTGDNAFNAIDSMRRTQQQIVVTEGGELTRELNLSGG
jgi:protocatechuate 3,4-dioxygenase beta subunit